MLLPGNLPLWALTLFVLLMLARALIKLTATATTVKTRRRSRRSHGRVVSRARRPAVMLSVRTARA